MVCENGGGCQGPDIEEALRRHDRRAERVLHREEDLELIDILIDDEEAPCDAVSRCRRAWRR
jgi:hypothetical protein